MRRVVTFVKCAVFIWKYRNEHIQCIFHVQQMNVMNVKNKWNISRHFFVAPSSVYAFVCMLRKQKIPLSLLLQMVCSIGMIQAFISGIICICYDPYTTCILSTTKSVIRRLCVTAKHLNSEFFVYFFFSNELRACGWWGGEWEEEKWNWTKNIQRKLNPNIINQYLLVGCVFSLNLSLFLSLSFRLMRGFLIPPCLSPFAVFAFMTSIKLYLQPPD